MEENKNARRSKAMSDPSLDESLSCTVSSTTHWVQGEVGRMDFASGNGRLIKIAGADTNPSAIMDRYPRCQTRHGVDASPPTT